MAQTKTVEKIEDNRTITQKVRDAWKDDPVVVILAASSAIFASAKFIDSVSSANSRRLQNRQSRYYFKVSRKHPLRLEPPI